MSEPRVFGGLEILARLDEGGMGEVLLARRNGAHGFEKLLAVKTVKSDLAKRADVRAMFLDEARLVASLVHPAIAQVHDFGEVDGQLYLAMEYVAGVPFSRWTQGSGHTPVLRPVIAAKLVSEVCRGLHAAHEHADPSGRALDVVHRDVSPQNLFFTFGGYVKILDFGIAKMRDRSAPATMIGQIKGKLAYLSPEQAAGDVVDRRTDVYAVAVVLHELLTGRRLYGDLPLLEVGSAILHRTPRPPSSIAPDVPAALDSIVKWGLEKEPSARFSTARAMADALDAVVAELGGCSLEAFADDALRDERDKHKTMLLRLATGDPSAIARPERPRVTMIDGAAEGGGSDESGPPRVRSDESAAREPGAPASRDSDTFEAASDEARRKRPSDRASRRRRSVPVLATGVVAFTLVLLVLFAIAGRSV
jgi:serine/threonine-protein kinase